MSIRKKPYYRGMTVPNGIGYSSMPWSSSPVATSGWDLHASSGDRGRFSSEDDERAKPRYISTPDWVEKIEDLTAECFEIGGYSCEVVAVCYKPERTLGVGFAKVYIVDKKTGQPFPQMKGVWKEVFKRRKDLENPYRQTCSVSEDGRVSGAFGIPDFISLSDAVQDMLVVWSEWEEFPKVETYEMVEKLHQAKLDVATMRREVKSNSINREIEEYRSEIRESQEKIAKLEKELNEIYEKAADAMNLLEENGVNVDEDSSSSIEIVANDEIDWSDLTVKCDPASLVTAGPPPSGILLSQVPITLTKKELDIINTLNADLGTVSAANAYNSVGTTLSCAS